MSMSVKSLQALKELMIHQGLTIAVAESLSCGWLQTMLGSISGSSAFFEGGLTVYNLRQKVNLLAINRQHAEQVNCVSELVAIELAEGVCRLYLSDIAIATTGYAEPNPDRQIYYPVAYFAICRRDINEKVKLITVKQVLGANLNRVEMQQYVAECAIVTLLEYLQAQ